MKSSLSPHGPEPELEPEPEEIESGAGDEPMTKILITRHSFSCNQKTKKKAFDPALTRNGINMAMERANYAPMGERLYDSDIVLVSCLLRTWQTALLLYNPEISGEDIEFSPKKNFTLYVYPHLKEHRKQMKVPLLGRSLGIDRGNYPTELKLTLANFLKFLEFIRINYSEYYNNSLPVHININIWNGGGHPLTFQLTRETNDSLFVLKINEEYCQGCWNMSQNTMINPFVDNSIFAKDGNLNTFVSNICTLPRPESEKLGPTGTIHVVAHSSLMRTYLGALSIPEQTLTIDDERGFRKSFMRDDNIAAMIIGNVSETNMFSFVMECGGSGPTLNKIYLGLSIPTTPPERNRELCDAGQFFDPNLVPRAKSEPEDDIYILGDKVKITGTRSGADGKHGTIVGYYIDGYLNDGDSGEQNLGLDKTKFEYIQKNKKNLIRVKYNNDAGVSVTDNFKKDKIHRLIRRNSVTLTLVCGGRLKKSKRKNKKTTKRKKNKNKSKRRRKSKRRKNTKRK